MEIGLLEDYIIYYIMLIERMISSKNSLREEASTIRDFTRGLLAMMVQEGY